MAAAGTGLYCANGGDMFFQKAKSIACAVCGKPINSKERRFIDKERRTKTERHAHIECHESNSVVPVAQA